MPKAHRNARSDCVRETSFFFPGCAVCLHFGAFFLGMVCYTKGDYGQAVFLVHNFLKDKYSVPCSGGFDCCADEGKEDEDENFSD